MQHRQNPIRVLTMVYNRITGVEHMLHVTDIAVALRLQFPLCALGLVIM
jgi:cell division protein FtsL